MQVQNSVEENQVALAEFNVLIMQLLTTRLQLNCMLKENVIVEYKSAENLEDAKQQFSELWKEVQVGMDRIAPNSLNDELQSTSWSSIQSDELQQGNQSPRSTSASEEINPPQRTINDNCNIF